MNQLHIIVLIFSMFKIISYYVRPPSTMNAILVTNILIVNSKPTPLDGRPCVGWGPSIDTTL